MITLTQLDTELQDLIASTSNIKADSGKRMRSLNRVLDKLNLKGNWNFQVRNAEFSYTAGTTEYSIEDDLSIDDFKEVYLLDGKPVSDPRKFDSEAESFAVRMKDGDHLLSVYLGTSDDTFDLEYFSTHMVKTNAGVWQLQFVNTSDQFLGPDDMKPTLLQMAYVELLKITKSSDKQEKADAYAEAEELLDMAFSKYGYFTNKGPKRITTIR